MADRKIYIQLEIEDKQAANKMAALESQIAKLQERLGPVESGFKGMEGGMQRSVVAGTTMGVVIADLVTKVGRNLVEGFQSAIAESVTLNNTFLGLSTVASAFKQDVGATTSAARELAADGLMTVAESAAGLKNLLASGFGLNEAIALMKGFKDSASFNRQASLGFGQAIIGATEGIKNQNSILVDNAGITKNLSVIMKEQGLAITDLGRVSTDAGVRQKLLGGLIKETAVFSGDAAKLTNTYSGAVAMLDTQWRLALASAGDMVTQNQLVVSGLLTGAEVLKNFGGTIILTTGALGALSLALAATKAIETVKAWSDARKAAEALGQTSKATALGLIAGWGAVAIAVTAATSAIVEYIEAQARAKVKGQEAEAVLDTIALAHERGYTEVKTYSEAIKANIEWMQKKLGTYQATGVTIATYNDIIAKNGKALREAMGAMKENGDQIDDVARKTGVSIEVAKQYQRELKATAEAHKLVAGSSLELAKAQTAAQTEGFAERRALLDLEHQHRMATIELEIATEREKGRMRRAEVTKYHAEILNIETAASEKVRDQQLKSANEILTIRAGMLGNALVMQQVMLDQSLANEIKALEKELGKTEEFGAAKLAVEREYEEKRYQLKVEAQDKLLSDLEKFEREADARQKALGLPGTLATDTRPQAEQDLAAEFQPRFDALATMQEQAFLSQNEFVMQTLELQRRNLETEYRERLQQLNYLDAATDQAASGLSLVGQAGARLTGGKMDPIAAPTTGYQLPKTSIISNADFAKSFKSNLKYYAEGGIVDRPHMGVVGENLGPGEFEAIIPSKKLPQMFGGGSVDNRLIIQNLKVDSQARVRQIFDEHERRTLKGVTRGRRQTLSTN